MVKVYLLKSGAKVLAEVRTDGSGYELFNDSTDGRVDRMARGSFKRLLEAVGRSSYLSLSLKRDQLPGILRYRLDTGDIIEMTTDGCTAVRNGQLLSQQEKDALLREIAYGRVTVVDKQDVAAAGKINESISVADRHAVNSDDADSRYREFGDSFARVSAAYSAGSAKNDPGIDDWDLSDMEWPDKIRTMVRYLRYGTYDR
jgi:hypothetical protein